MIDVTVKTLDSQNHRYSVPDDITVKQFKERIATSVSITADKQRLIYCGRVLQDDKKLADYNVHEKVVHLVMRAPPVSTSRSSGAGGSSSNSTSGSSNNVGGASGSGGHHHRSHHHHYHIHHHQRNNGSTQGTSSSGVRLQQARTMLERASGILDRLDAGVGANATERTESADGDNADNHQASTSVSVEGSSTQMETESSGISSEATSAASVTPAATPPSQEMEELYSEMDALNNMDPSMIGGATMVGPAALGPGPMMGVVNGSLAGGLAQAASAAVASALSSLARGGGQHPTNIQANSQPTPPPPPSTRSSESPTTPGSTNVSSTNTSSENANNSNNSSNNSSTTARPTTTGAAAGRTGTQRGSPVHGGMRAITVRITNNRPGGSNSSGNSESSNSNTNSNNSSSRSAGRGVADGREETTIPATNAEATTTADAGGSAVSASEGVSSEGSGGNEGGSSESAGGSSNIRLEHPRCSVMVEILDQYNTVQQRLQPYLARYHASMTQDPTYEEGEVSLEQSQWLLWRVSEVLHFISHALHAISDIMVDLRRPPPRQLRARPIIIQQPALVQAQINVTTSAEPARVVMTGPAGARQTLSTNSSTTTNTTTTTTSSDTNSNSNTNTGTPTVPTSTEPPSTSSSSTQASTSTTTTSSTTSSSSRNGWTGRSMASQMFNLGQSMGGFPMDGGDLVVMEVGPQGITIDSISAEGGPQGGGGAPTPELIRNLVSSITNQLGVRLGQPGPATSTNSSNSTTSSSSAATSSAAATSNAASTSSAGPQRAPPVRNSQAAGNSGTNTTNVTQTRVTHRPHVHVTPLSVPGMGMNQFDPFLPCQSHHIRPATTRRRHQPQSQAQNSESPSRANRRSPSTSRESPASEIHVEVGGPGVGISPSADPNNPLSMIANIMAQAFSGQQQQQQQQQQSSQPASDSDSNVQNQQITDQMFAQLLQGVMSQVSGTMGPEGTPINTGQAQPSLHEFLQPFAGDMFNNDTDEDSLFNQLFYMISQSLSMVDLIQLAFGRATTVNQLREPLQEFVRERALRGNGPTEENMDRAIDNVISDLNTHLEQAAASVRVQDGIDYVNTINNFIRHRLHDIFNLVLTHSDVETFGPTLVALVRRALGEFIALSLHCFTDGAEGLERVIQDRVRCIMGGVSPAIQTWSINTSLVQLRSMMAMMTITDDHIRRYVVSPEEGLRMEEERRRRQNSNIPNSTTQTSQPSSQNHNNLCEAMDVDEMSSVEEVVMTSDAVPEVETASIAATASMLAAAAAESRIRDADVENEPLPDDPPVTVNVGSQPWHSNVPQEWIPVLTRDIERQRRGVPETNLSDAYLCGMPLKRRKIASQHKPHGSVQNVVQDTLRSSMRSSGINRAVVESVSGEAATQLSESFVTHVRENLQEKLKNDKDFRPERFPKSEENIRKSK